MKTTADKMVILLTFNEDRLMSGVRDYPDWYARPSEQCAFAIDQGLIDAKSIPEPPRELTKLVGEELWALHNPAELLEQPPPPAPLQNELQMETSIYWDALGTPDGFAHKERWGYASNFLGLIYSPGLKKLAQEELDEPNIGFGVNKAKVMRRFNKPTWVAFNPNVQREDSDEDYNNNGLYIGQEILWMAKLFPKWVASWDKNGTYPVIAGCRIQSMEDEMNVFHPVLETSWYRGDRYFELRATPWPPSNEGHSFPTIRSANKYQVLNVTRSTTPQ